MHDASIYEDFYEDLSHKRKIERFSNKCRRNLNSTVFYVFCWTKIVKSGVLQLLLNKKPQIVRFSIICWNLKLSVFRAFVEQETSNRTSEHLLKKKPQTKRFSNIFIKQRMSEWSVPPTFRQSIDRSRKRAESVHHVDWNHHQCSTRHKSSSDSDNLGYKLGRVSHPAGRAGSP